MKTSTVIFGIVFFAATAVHAQMPNGPGPIPPRVAYVVAPILSVGGGGPAAIMPSASAQILALQKSEAGYALLVTASDSAWVSCKISAAGVDFATGESWIPKTQKVLITLSTQFNPTQPPASYDASCIPQFLDPPGGTAQKNFDVGAVTSILSYSLSPEPEPVTVLATDADWTPTFPVSEPGTLTMVFDDKVPGLAATIDTNPDQSPSTRKLAAPVLTSALQEGKYYRYHFTGKSQIGDGVLVQQNKTYLLYKNTTPQLSTAIDLISQPDGIEVKFGLTRELKHLELQFPSGVALNPKAKTASGAASWTYDFVIPTDLQAAASSIGTTTAQGITKSLNDATTTSGGTPTATGTLKLSIINHDLPTAPTIAELTLSVVRVSAPPLIMP